MPAKVTILAQFGHGYYIRGTLKWLMGASAWLKAWWIRFGHGYYIHGTLKWLMGVSAWLKAWSQTRNPFHCCLAREEMPTKVVILAHFGHGYYIHGTLKRLTDVVAWLKAWWIRMLWLGSRLGGSVSRLGESVEEMPTKVVILAHFGHGYYIHGTLKRLTDVVTWLKEWWICIRNPCHCCLAEEEMPTKVMILAQFDYGYYIRGTLNRLTDVVARLKAWWICTRNPCHCCLAEEEMPTKVMILAQFDYGYYIRGTLNRLTDVVARLKAWWICVSLSATITASLAQVLRGTATASGRWPKIHSAMVEPSTDVPSNSTLHRSRDVGEMGGEGWWLSRNKNPNRPGLACIKPAESDPTIVLCRGLLEAWVQPDNHHRGRCRLNPF
ncbi:hypothetical protein C8R44DRAFT_746261 [Mycena epipterygia]|nr:hypothetical protein C8R44DRAFT_746261 [Mycena epipterygia]